ncbi:competence pheromone ComX [Paenibacillus sp. D2_2]|uniref:competence pheromone ComX n=1 Tax=Paenibacillus sp. D2_2 TaxID=3073092 RepID=UPI002815F698|nr:competence pheromone ComX [Paenibacillus sp. D2_2]WMT41486.1 competence pheromone ComX [Paenibacillus sp. D2_2]
MLKELIQALVKDSGAMMNIRTGQLQLAGMSAVEQRALIDVLRDKGNMSNEPMKASVWS